MPDMSIIITARRWFQRTYGNTYHSVVVYIDGQLVGSEPFVYGYGDGFMQTALSIIQDGRGLFNTREHFANGGSRDYYDFTNYIREHRDICHIDVTDVQRRKDL